MKHLIKATLGFGLALTLWQVPADADLLDLKKKEQVPNNLAAVSQSNPAPQPASSDNSYNEKVASNKVSLRFENLSLIHVLQNIQKETGILFSINPAMKTIPVSATIQADNWETAIKKLLKGFSRIEVWTGNLKTSRIWFVSGRRTQPKGFLQKKMVELPQS
tara:strand:- start:165 stop:650 length:486 start_codon:yes stop_codon:yes gene_type:complete